MSDVFFSIALCIVIVLFGALGLHHFLKTRRALRSGVIDGLIIGYWGKRFEREYEPEAFWVNVWAGFIATSVGGLVVFLGVLIISIIVAAYFGVEVINL